MNEGSARSAWKYTGYFVGRLPPLNPRLTIDYTDQNYTGYELLASYFYAGNHKVCLMIQASQLF